MRRPVVLALFCALAVRCGSDTPALNAIEPSSGPNDRDVAVVIRGQALEPTVAVDVGCNGRATANANFSASLDTSPNPTALAGVIWQGGDLGATVPAHLEPGVYDVTVRTPQGATLRLPQAYTVLGPGGDGGSDANDNDGGNCETLYADSQTVQGNFTTNDGNNATGPPDGMSGSVQGMFSNRMGTWTFRFPAATLSGRVRATVSVIMAVGSGYVDDRLAIEVSQDAASNFTTLASFGTPDPLPPTSLMLVGPLPAPTITTVPATGQLVVRISGTGSSGPSDTYTLRVDSVAVEFCP